MSVEKRPRGVYIAIIISVFILTAIVYIYFLYPVISAGAEQPIPFSHRLHATVKQLDCKFCHSTVDNTRFAGMPSVDKCLYCHEHVIPTHPVIRKLHAYAGEDIPEFPGIKAGPIPWVKVTWLPDHVYFTHERHIKAGVVCEECHGDVAGMDRVKQTYINKMDGDPIGSSPFEMGFCMECHQKSVEYNGKLPGSEHARTTAELVEENTGKFEGTRAPTDCWTCHQ